MGASPEVQALLIWSLGRSHEDSILADLESRFDILRVVELTWSRNRFSDNLRRFYGTNLPHNSSKEERECGHGPFLLVIVRDTSPKYGVRKTTSGQDQRVNVTMFDLKQSYRARRAEGFSVHSTNDIAEARRDICLLLGVAEVQQLFVAHSAPTWNGSIEHIQRDVTGANGWSDLHELFSVFDTLGEWLVLRNWEGLSAGIVSSSHGDIDLLVSDLRDFSIVAGAKAMRRGRNRVQFEIRISGAAVFFDLRHLGDNYYDLQWQQHLLAGRLRIENGIWVASPRQHYWSLLYHALIHKPALSTEYRDRLTQMSGELGIVTAGPSAWPRELARFMGDNHYSYTIPDDRSVHVNTSNIPPSTKPVRRRRGSRLFDRLDEAFFYGWQWGLGRAIRAKGAWRRRQHG